MVRIRTAGSLLMMKDGATCSAGSEGAAGVSGVPRRSAPLGGGLWALSAWSRAQPQDEGNMQDGVLEVPDGPLSNNSLLDWVLLFFQHCELMGLNCNLKEHSLP